jgi:hypothetical protein
VESYSICLLVIGFFSVSKMSSRLSMLYHMSEFLPFLKPNSIPLCSILSFAIHSSVDGSLGQFHVLAIVNNALSLWLCFQFLWIYNQKWTFFLDLFWLVILFFLRNCHTVFYTFINGTQRSQYFHIPVYACFFVCLFVLDMKWNPLVLICISPVTSDVEHLFMDLLAICILL